MEQLVRICRKHHLDAASGAVIGEPYIPFIPQNWNGVLVLAEAQNLSEGSSEYVARLKTLTPDERIRRLYLLSDRTGVQPWDDGSLKLAVAAIFPNSSLDTYGVSNAVLWSLRSSSGNNANPNRALIKRSISVWTEMFAELNPRLVIAAGKVAKKVVARAFGGHFLAVRLPSPQAMSRISGMFDEADLRERFPEVESALRHHPELVEGPYRHNKIFFACHAVSMARAQKLVAAG